MLQIKQRKSTSLLLLINIIILESQLFLLSCLCGSKYTVQVFLKCYISKDICAPIHKVHQQMWFPEELKDRAQHTLLSWTQSFPWGKSYMVFRLHLSCSIAFTSHCLNILHGLLVSCFLIGFRMNYLLKKNSHFLVTQEITP